MLHAGLDLSRGRLDFCLLGEAGDTVEVGAVAPDADGLDGFARGVERRHRAVAVRAAIESMTGARFIHVALERRGWEVEVADAIKVKGLAPLACKTDRIDAWVLAELSRRDRCRPSGCRTSGSARSASGRAGGCIWSRTAASSSTVCIRC